MSDMEREFELDMDEGEVTSAGDELPGELESLAGFELDEPEQEFEVLDEPQQELEVSLDGGGGDFAERFYELSTRQYESGPEIDQEIDARLDELEREYFFKGLGARLKRAGKGLLQKGLKYAAGQFPALQALQGITQLTRGNLKGLLASLAKTGLAAAVPGGAAALPALKALGFETTEDPQTNREAWNNYVEVAREAFDHLAQNLHERADDPLEASRLATTAFHHGLKRVRARGNRRPAGSARVIRLRPGQRIVIVGG
jgi:hypothetical protein